MQSGAVDRCVIPRPAVCMLLGFAARGAKNIAFRTCHAGAPTMALVDCFLASPIPTSTLGRSVRVLESRCLDVLRSSADGGASAERFVKVQFAWVSRAAYRGGHGEQYEVSIAACHDVKDGGSVAC